MATSTAATSGTTSSILTTTIPMTARFTPPSSCSSSWTFEPSGANGIAEGLLIQNAATSDNVNPSCWPSGFEHYGRVQPTQVFSPGYCPVGYTSADVGIEQPVTSAACCLSGYTYIGSISDTNGLTYAGCTKLFPSGNSTIVTVRQDHSSSTQVTGPVTMWAQPILVALESSDSSLFVPAMTTTSSSSMPTAQSSSTTRSHATEATYSNTSATNPSSTSGLSTGAKAGIGIGAGIGALGAVALIAAIIIFRRRKQAKPRIDATSTPQQPYNGGPTSQPNSLSQPGHFPFQYPSTYQSTKLYAAELNGEKDYPGGRGVPPAELEGRH